MTAAKWVVVACAVSVAPAVPAPSQPDRVRAVVGATLIDGTGRAPLADSVVLIRDGRIERVGRRGQVQVPADGRVVRADGKFLLPGFIDAHIHYRDYYPEMLVSHGITSAAEWGGSPLDWTLAQRDGIRAGKILGPRLYTAGDNFSEEPEDQTIAKASEWLDEMLALGVDKIDVGFPTPPDVLRVIIDRAHRANLPVSGYPAYVQDAIDLGIDAIKHTYVVGIASQSDPTRLAEIRRQAALPYRKRDIELPLVGPDSRALAKRMAERNVYWVPTLVKDFKVIHDRRDEFEIESLRLLGDPNLDYIPRDDMFLMTTNWFGVGIPTPGGSHFAGLVERRFDRIDRGSAAFRKYHDGYRNLQALARNLVAAGGRVLSGTAPHSYVLPGLSLHQEMQLLVDAGLTPMQALQSAGLWVAQYLRKERDLGSVETGKLADLVLLDHDPLADIRNTRSVRMVLQGGRELPLGYHITYRNPIPRNTHGTAPGAASPRPRLRLVTPATTRLADRALDVALHGDSYLEGAVVHFDGRPLETRYVSPTEVRATIPPFFLDGVGTHWLTVVNPPPGRSASTPLSFLVVY